MQLLTQPLSAGGRQLFVVAGSVLDYRGDAFVNAANEGCTGGFGVDELVNQSGGPELKEARKLLGGCPTGEAKATMAFDHANTKHIVHVVGPVYRVNKLKQGFDDDDSRAGPYMLSLDSLLRDAYRASLRAAGECGARSVGMCILSAGVFRGARPLEDVLVIGLRTLAYALMTRSACAEGIDSVTLCAYTLEEQQMLTAVAERLADELARGGEGSDHDLTRDLLSA